MLAKKRAQQVDAFQELIRTKMFGEDFTEGNPNKPLTREDLDQRLQNIKNEKIFSTFKDGSGISQTFDKWFEHAKSNVMSLDAIRSLFKDIRDEMDIDRATDSSSSSEDDNPGSRTAKSNKRKHKPSDDLDKRLLLQNFALQSQDYDLFKRATQLEAAEMTELIKKENALIEAAQVDKEKTKL